MKGKSSSSQPTTTTNISRVFGTERWCRADSVPTQASSIYCASWNSNGTFVSWYPERHLKNVECNTEMHEILIEKHLLSTFASSDAFKPTFS